MVTARRVVHGACTPTPLEKRVSLQLQAVDPSGGRGRTLSCDFLKNFYPVPFSLQDSNAHLSDFPPSHWSGQCSGARVNACKRDVTPAIWSSDKSGVLNALTRNGQRDLPGLAVWNVDDSLGSSWLNREKGDRNGATSPRRQGRGSAVIRFSGAGSNLRWVYLDCGVGTIGKYHLERVTPLPDGLIAEIKCERIGNEAKLWNAD